MNEQRTFKKKSHQGWKETDIVQTHCGFIEPKDPMHGWGPDMQRKCDQFMLREYGMIWQPRAFGLGDYVPIQ